jgi:hypothetical protein
MIQSEWSYRIFCEKARAPCGTTEAGASAKNQAPLSEPDDPDPDLGSLADGGRHRPKKTTTE